MTFEYDPTKPTFNTVYDYAILVMKSMEFFRASLEEKLGLGNVPTVEVLSKDIELAYHPLQLSPIVPGNLGIDVLREYRAMPMVFDIGCLHQRTETRLDAYDLKLNTITSKVNSGVLPLAVYSVSEGEATLSALKETWTETHAMVRKWSMEELDAANFEIEFDDVTMRDNGEMFERVLLERYPMLTREMLEAVRIRDVVLGSLKKRASTGVYYFGTHWFATIEPDTWLQHHHFKDVMAAYRFTVFGMPFYVFMPRAFTRCLMSTADLGYKPYSFKGQSAHAYLIEHFGSIAAKLRVPDDELFQAVTDYNTNAVAKPNVNETSLTKERTDMIQRTPTIHQVAYVRHVHNALKEIESEVVIPDIVTKEELEFSDPTTISLPEADGILIPEEAFETYLACHSLTDSLNGYSVTSVKVNIRDSDQQEVTYVLFKKTNFYFNQAIADRFTKTLFADLDRFFEGTFDTMDVLKSLFRETLGGQHLSANLDQDLKDVRVERDAFVHYLQNVLTPRFSIHGDEVWETADQAKLLRQLLHVRNVYTFDFDFKQCLYTVNELLLLGEEYHSNDPMDVCAIICNQLVTELGWRFGTWLTQPSLIQEQSEKESVMNNECVSSTITNKTVAYVYLVQQNYLGGREGTKIPILLEDQLGAVNVVDFIERTVPEACIVPAKALEDLTISATMEEEYNITDKTFVLPSLGGECLYRLVSNHTLVSDVLFKECVADLERASQNAHFLYPIESVTTESLCKIIKTYFIDIKRGHVDGTRSIEAKLFCVLGAEDGSLPEGLDRERAYMVLHHDLTEFLSSKYSGTGSEKFNVLYSTALVMLEKLLQLFMGGRLMEITIGAPHNVLVTVNDAPLTAMESPWEFINPVLSEWVRTPMSSELFTDCLPSHPNLKENTMNLDPTTEVPNEENYALDPHPPLTARGVCVYLKARKEYDALSEGSENVAYLFLARYMDWFDVRWMDFTSGYAILPSSIAARYQIEFRSANVRMIEEADGYVLQAGPDVTDDTVDARVKFALFRKALFWAQCELEYNEDLDWIGSVVSDQFPPVMRFVLGNDELDDIINPYLKVLEVELGLPGTEIDRLKMDVLRTRTLPRYGVEVSLDTYDCLVTPFEITQQFLRTLLMSKVLHDLHITVSGTELVLSNIAMGGGSALNFKAALKQNFKEDLEVEIRNRLRRQQLHGRQPSNAEARTMRDADRVSRAMAEERERMVNPQQLGMPTMYSNYQPTPPRAQRYVPTMPQHALDILVKALNDTCPLSQPELIALGPWLQQNGLAAMRTDDGTYKITSI